MALFAEVARTYLQLRSTQAQLDINSANLAVADRTCAWPKAVSATVSPSALRNRFGVGRARQRSRLVPELVQRRNTLMNAFGTAAGVLARPSMRSCLKRCLARFLPTPVGLPPNWRTGGRT